MSEWQDQAACRERTDLTWFPNPADYGGTGGRGGVTVGYLAAVEAACAVCRTCPVLVECRAAGTGESGIWGGEMHRLQVRYTEPRVLQPCGTPAAYRRHRANGEEPCRSCREAHAAMIREAKDMARAARVAAVRQMLGRSA